MESKKSLAQEKIFFIIIFIYIFSCKNDDYIDEYKQGKFLVSTEYRLGKKQKSKIFDEQGILLQEFLYDKDSIISEIKEYYPNNNIKVKYSFVTDHLGNVRLSYTKPPKGEIEILEETNYYPFGMRHEGYNNLSRTPKYQYKYNGKELQETGMYDYGARFYLPDIGRWFNVDPLAESTLDPYGYVWNNPINRIDPTGMQGWGFFVEKKA